MTEQKPEHEYTIDFNTMIKVASAARHETPIESLTNLLSDAITSPWIRYDYTKVDSVEDAYKAEYDEDARSIELHLAYYLLHGCSIRVIDVSAIEEDDATEEQATHILTMADLDKGADWFVKEGSKHFGDFVTMYDDEITGEVFVQYACFQEVRYC